VHKYLLVRGPVFKDVPFWREQTNKGYVKREIVSDSMLSFHIFDERNYDSVVSEIFGAQLMHITSDLNYKM
jgi:hypothetical protein